MTTPPKVILNPQELTVTKAGDGQGALKAPYGLTCEAACATATFLYTGGTGGLKPKPAATVTLVASPAAGSTLSGWSGCESNPSASECVVSMSNEREVTATFDQ
jgi:hypothetical protein